MSRSKRFIYGKWYQYIPSKGIHCFDRLSIIWKSDLSDRIKRIFFQQRPPSFHFSNHPNKMNKRYKTLMEKQGWRVALLWTPSHKHGSIGRPTRTYRQNLCTDTGYSLEELPEEIDDSIEWQERVREIHASSATWWWYIYIYIYIYIYACLCMCMLMYIYIYIYI